MFTASVSGARVECPACHATLTDWSARCPKCRYHPDCDDRDCYNRAQDDVALMLRSHVAPEPPPAGAPASGHSWRRFLPPMFRPPGAAAN